MAAWKTETAKARFSELLRAARTDGPQEITIRGRPAAVILSVEDYERLSPARSDAVNWVDDLIASADGGFDLDFQVDRSAARSFAFDADS